MPSQVKATETLFKAVEEQFDRASVQAPVIRHHIVLAGQSICLEFAGPALVDRILPAIAHLSAVNGNADAPADLTVRIWDTVSTGIGAPKMPWTQDDFTSRREVAGANTDKFRVAYDLYCGVLSIVSFGAGLAYWWISEADKLPLYESAAPLREILQAWMGQIGGVFVHAAALGTDEAAILLVGRGGAGKTTTAIACASAGMPLLGEDYCLLTDLNADKPRVHSLYSSAKMTSQSLAMMPHLEQYVINPERADASDKAILMLNQAFAMQSHATVRAIIIPQRTESGRTELSTATETQALMALAPSTILQLSGMDQTALSKMKHLVERVPAYRLEIGGSPQEAAGVLANLIAGHV